MSPTPVSVIATLLYCLSAYLIFRQLHHQENNRLVSCLPAAVAMLLQAFDLNQLIYQSNGLNLGFFIAFSLISWLITIQIIISSFYPMAT